MQFPFKTTRWVRILAKTAGIFIVLLLLAFFGFRNLLLKKAIERISAKMEKKYHTSLVVDHGTFNGITGIQLLGISMVPEGRDTLLRIDTFETSVRFWPVLIGSIRIKEIKIRHGFARLTKQNGVSNFDVFFKTKNDSTVDEPTMTLRKPENIANRIYHLVDALLDQIPTQMEISELLFQVSDERLFAGLFIENLTQHGDDVNATLRVTDALNPEQHWRISGYGNPANKKADIHFYNLDTGKVLIPYINQKFHLHAGFDSIHLRLDGIEMTNGTMKINGYSGITNFLVNHPKISTRDVLVNNASFTYQLILGPDYISIDSLSTITFNSISIHPFVKLTTGIDTIFNLAIGIPKTPAQEFISSLPEGLFKHFKGMQVKGDFEYRLDFAYNENHPEGLVFESKLKKYDLSILKYGEADLSKLNWEFEYVPIERGRPQRPVFIGISNPYYTTLDQISPYLQKCVLTTEDPSFFYHRGFIDEAFRQSIIKNIRQRKFARGASTISMQLVKNVFLTREKTISRKLEEILLVYILENNRISTKDRMLEVYFNIIEWGPNVYGIGEASEFYFKKKPSQLTLEECLFLATIIPRPKGFMWRFDKEGHLKPFADKQFTFLRNIMLRRNLLAPEDTLRFNVPIVISGKAKSLIRIDTLQGADTSMLIDDKGVIRRTDEDD